jgi:hypothetical protein
MFMGRPLAVSLPALELASVTLPGSVFNADDLRGAPISEGLRTAVDLILLAAEDSPVKFLARPEIFTHGETLEWLNKTLDGTTDHLCLSDGSTIRVVPGMANHVFFYAMGRTSHLEAARKLFTRAPELFAGLKTQVNTAMKWRTARGRIAPPSLHVQAEAALDERPTDLYAFYLNPLAPADSAAYIFAAPSGTTEQLGQTPITLIPLTEVAIHDQDFMNHVAALMTRAYFDPSLHVVLGLPRAADAEQTEHDRLTVFLEALAHTEAVPPRVKATNIHVSASPFPKITAIRARSTLLAHDSLEVWRLPAAQIRRFETVAVAKPRRQTLEIGAGRLLSNLLGRPASVIRCRTIGGHWPWRGREA